MNIGRSTRRAHRRRSRLRDQVIQATELPPDEHRLADRGARAAVGRGAARGAHRHRRRDLHQQGGQDAQRSRGVDRRVGTAGRAAVSQHPRRQGSPAELRTCIEKSFATWKPARPLLKSVSFTSAKNRGSSIASELLALVQIALDIPEPRGHALNFSDGDLSPLLVVERMFAGLRLAGVALLIFFMG